MPKPFFSLLFLLISGGLFGQQRLPVFAVKQDSAAYEEVNAQLMDAMKNPRFTFRIDSLIKASNHLRERAIRYRTVYRPSADYEKYGNHPMDLKRIRRLSLVGYKGKTLPDSIYLFSNLTDLELVNTQIKKLPKELATLRLLKQITLLNNRPAGRLRLTRNDSIKTLAIHDDEFNKLPGNYRKFKNLRGLDLSRCNLTQFPNIKGNKNLLRLTLNDNRLSLQDLRGSLPLLEELVLTSNSIKQVPSTIGNFSGLKKLNLNSNNIESIAPEIGKLQKLEQLSLYKNNLRSLPHQLYDLSNLRIIDLYYNQFEQLDSGIVNWVNLEILYAANNKLFSLPQRLGNLTRLKELYVHHNRLSTLPETLGGLDSLRVLRANNNLLVELPVTLYGLKSLENLDVANNQIQVFPEALFTFPKLRILSLKNNPLDASAKESVIQWAKKAIQERNVVVHLEGASEPDGR